jgi:N-acetylneuraminate synthase
MEKLSIAGRAVGPGEKPWIIAEIGSNHNGDMELCRQLVDEAAASGADAVKFQSWSKQSLIGRAEYRRNTAYCAAERNGSTLEQQVERYQLTPEQHREIADHCRERGIVFFSSCFSSAEVDLLMALDVPAFKIASMDVNYPQLLDYVASMKKPILLSTGLATLGEIERACGIIRSGGAPLALLHCVSIYPSPPEIVNLRNMDVLRAAFDVPVGYSDHTLGTAIPLAAIAMGACIIEKHFTLDKSLPGWDHSVSADPAEMRELTRGACEVFAALGSPVRSLTPAQLEKRKTFRRRMIARGPLKKGHRLTAADVDFKRPGTGIHPDEAAYVLNRCIARDLADEDEIEWTDVV